VQYSNDLQSIGIIANAGRPVPWAVVCRETSGVYVTLVSDLKQTCERQMTQGEQFNPSCHLVNNSDPEINAARYEHSSLPPDQLYCNGTNTAFVATAQSYPNPKRASAVCY
jgi:hypothetical protein